MILIWNGDNQSGLCDKGEGKFNYWVKPELSFAFDSLFYEPTNHIKVIAGEWIALSEAEIAEIEIQIYQVKELSPQENPAETSHVVDGNGSYLGEIPTTDALADSTVTIVAEAPPGDGFYLWNKQSQAWFKIQAVDAEGKFVGNVPYGSYAQLVDGPPPKDYMIWDFANDDWVDARPLGVIIAELHSTIDQAAGNLRAKYITSVVGQAETYIYKSIQAKEFLSLDNPNDYDYPLLMAEVEAMQVANPGATIVDAANAILAQETAWMGLAAIVEKERRAGKERVSLCEKPNDAHLAASEAIQRINQIG